MKRILSLLLCSALMFAVGCAGKPSGNEPSGEGGQETNQPEKLKYFEDDDVIEVVDAEDVRELTALLKHRNCHVNLIPVNPIKERDYQRPAAENALDFKNKLEKNGINVTIRRERGSDIDGACGQLRRRYQTVQKEN